MEELLRVIKDLTLYGLEKLGLYYSKYRAFVADNEDPQGYGRLKVSVPEIHGDEVLNYWAYPGNNFSGKGYGAQVIPKLNDMVWVEFEKGRANKPIWYFGHFGKDEKPTELKDIKNFWFKTPEGHTIEFNDTDSTIKITSVGGRIVHMGKDFISLGSKDQSKEPAVYGDTLQKKLEDLIKILQEAKVMTQLGPQTFMPDAQAKLVELNLTLKEIKSTVITLD